MGAGYEGSISLERSSSGAAFFRPASVPAAAGRLNDHQAETLRDLQLLGDQIAAAQLRLDELVEEARSQGISWALIGWSVGLTGEGARGRWG